MTAQPQDAISPPSPAAAAPYRPSPRILALADWIGDRVSAADFLETRLRWRNDRAAAQIGLASFSDEEWVRHFGRFEPLPDNLPGPLALRYHGHQFRVYNPDLGDGRGFTFAQMLDAGGRLMDLGTKGSGQTPWSRAGDGRLTLKGAVREILATEMLEALGVNTSRTLSVIETGESLWRGDEPSPTRSAVLVRLSHGHIRIGTFQRLAALQCEDEMAQLVGYCLANFPGPAMAEDTHPAIRFFNQVVERMADMAASYMVAGFVHGVLNSDNMNVTGESFDYGPWRWLPAWEPGFTAAYFDHGGLYAYGRQPEAIHWNCGQLAVALRSLVEAAPLIEALNRYPQLYQQAMARRWCWRLGLVPRGLEEDTAMIGVCEQVMARQNIGPDAFFFRHRGGRGPFGSSAEEQALKEALAPYHTISSNHPYWSGPEAQSMLIHEVEAIWQPIAANDDWSRLDAKIVAVREMGEAMGKRPEPAGHAG
ncbi:MAG: protein adenylyltransferase SelO family protein [Novosphingobium meiothermophilum]